MFEDGVVYRDCAQYLGKPVEIPAKGRERQAEMQVRSKFQQVADESVVVSKFRPVKASNGVEEKTGMTSFPVTRTAFRPKAGCGCEGTKFLVNLVSMKRLVGSYAACSPMQPKEREA
ncbi:hypothetical protein [Salinispira pacifica]|uniref:hypothetical protein n=1 Tax=Salinispira pacifica TaxID=1307761 RepID=UPI00059DB109|nr:hypothetical protein [Salinispira pacifica]